VYLTKKNIIVLYESFKLVSLVN